MVQSMTGFASGQGGFEQFQWGWDIRSVNAKGLDIRLRVPDWVSGLEADLKAMIGKSLSRGSVSLSLRLSREGGEQDLQLNAESLNAALRAFKAVETAATQQGVLLTPPTPADILGMRGVMDQKSDDADTGALKNAIVASFEEVLSELLDMRQSEGQALHTVLSQQIDLIEQLVASATDVLVARRADMDAAYRAALARVVDNSDKLDQDRIAQEIALVAVKSDVTEEIDRLNAHIGAARDLLMQGVKIGRKLDFLSQEFNREANTLCSKSQHKSLTAIGLELKAVIDQMREQVQNVE
ncbi:MAG: YicC/YloC family endoribonuclease [Paracoccaceae bacterium]|nr:YicC/YloC family endoribonuclease [Paracoccaceae bacterium]MDP7184354.1 YicC/YloC family endoribonuclease [Paracoccaceae bacterium]